MAKLEPAVTQLLYQVPDGTSYIDIAKDLSKVNRRLYRQGYTYVVQDVQIAQSIGTQVTDISQISFATTGNSWIVHNAWKKGFAAWRKQQRALTDALGPVSGKWADFKVYLDDSMEDATILEPYATDGAVYAAGEWVHSKLVFDDDGVEREFKMHLIGSSNLADTNNESAIGLIQEYQNSRRFPTNDPYLPSEASDTIYAKLLGTDEMSDMMVGNLEDDNDLPPYDADEYPGGDTNADAAVPARFGSITSTISTTTMAGFIAPCGLVKLSVNEIQLDSSSPAVYEATSSPTLLVMLTMAVGPYRGVLAAPMGQ